MFDKPAGAAQIRTVPKEVRCYERIKSIEFIERNPLYENPRSAAYMPTESGAIVRLCYNDASMFDETLTKEQAQTYIKRLDERSLFDLDYSYRPIEKFILDSDIWRIKVEFSPNEDGSKVHDYISEGDAGYPDCYEELAFELLLQDEFWSCLDEQQDKQQGEQ